MGIPMTAVHTMDSYGLLQAGRKVLDIGSSNLYNATSDAIATFISKHKSLSLGDLDTIATRLADGSMKDASGNALNRSFVGEMFEACGLGYDAIDIAVGYKTTVVDLNTSGLPQHMVGDYDTVLNFGTSEHILNQMNVFATIHAATKVGGFIMHAVPSIGYVDHGYYCYTSRFFFDLAGYNEYEVVDMWFDEPAGPENVFASARQYQTYFPSLTKRLGQIGQAKRETVLDQIGIPVISLNIIYKKTKDVPFMGTVETSTSVGAVPGHVTEKYKREEEMSSEAPEEPLQQLTSTESVS